MSPETFSAFAFAGSSDFFSAFSALFSSWATTGSTQADASGIVIRPLPARIQYLSQRSFRPVWCTAQLLKSRDQYRRLYSPPVLAGSAETLDRNRVLRA